MVQTSVQGVATGLGAEFILLKVAARDGSSKVFAHRARRG
jgi:hypothetical protein